MFEFNNPPNFLEPLIRTQRMDFTEILGQSGARGWFDVQMKCLPS